MPRDIRLDQMMSKAVECAEHIKKHERALVVSHIDADGLTSGAIAVLALERAGLTCEVMFLKQLDKESLERITDSGYELVVFTDLGSGLIDTIESLDINAVVVDHHIPSQSNYVYHLNPCLFGVEGSYEASGSTMTYILARALQGDLNVDLSPLAVVGAVGDLQQIKKGKLTGLNRIVLEQGKRKGYISYINDLKLFGKQTKPVFKLLQYSVDPVLPGLTGREDACISFLKECGIELKGERWKRWIDLTQNEKRKVVSSLIKHCIAHGLSPDVAQQLVGEVYILEREREGTELRDASEYSTLLNATARYDEAEVGLAVCLGDRERALSRARTLLGEHRKNLVDGISFVMENGVIKRESYVYFDAGSRIKDTIVGIVAGMSMSMIGREVPIIAIAETDDGKLKISARTTQSKARKGINLAEALSMAASIVGGVGGGHPVAAGATIPRTKKDEFLNALEKILCDQLGN
ncbi:recombinase RecJ [Methanosarcinales archaeon]|nr:MAG: recombinase RecJ [Methanosarcinales archaeon]